MRERDWLASARKLAALQSSPSAGSAGPTPSQLGAITCNGRGASTPRLHRHLASTRSPQSADRQAAGAPWPAIRERWCRTCGSRAPPWASARPLRRQSGTRPMHLGRRRTRCPARQTRRCATLRSRRTCRQCFVGSPRGRGSIQVAEATGVAVVMEATGVMAAAAALAATAAASARHQPNTEAEGGQVKAEAPGACCCRRSRQSACIPLPRTGRTRRELPRCLGRWPRRSAARR